MSSRTFVSVALTALFLGSVSGCTKNEPPKPDSTAVVVASSNAATARPKLNVRNPMGPMARIDPAAMKDYRIDICYYGTLSLRQARDSYLASLGKSEPSEKKIPNFGVANADGAKPAAAAAAAKPAAPAPRPAASGAPSSTPPGPARPFDFALRAPHERNARACTASMALKEPAMPGVDEALAVFGPYSVELAKDIATATSYYQREEYKKDSFAKGLELHKKLLEEFGKLDEQQEKLGAALDTYRKAHAPDPTKIDEGEKITNDTFEDARKVVMALAEKKLDVAAYKANIDKLDKAVEALKTFSSSHAGDTWSKIMAAPFEAFLRSAKDAKVSEKGVAPEDFLNLVTGFTGLVEARQRGLQRAMITKGQVTQLIPPPAMAAPADSIAPAPAALPQP
ncbi:MAG: DUF3829 domain-containing protein [Byssovorax sp.]